MAAYYHPHHHHGTNTEIQDHNSNNNNNNNNFHTLILMNPNLADAQHHHHNHHHHHPQPPQPPPSHNILLLNSAATLSPPPPPPLQQAFLSNPHHFARPPNNVTLYGYPSHEARDIPRARQGLSLTLSSQNPALGGGPHHGGDADVAAGGGGGGGGGGVLGSKYLKAAQELLEEVVDVRDDGVGFFKSSSNTTTPTNTTNNNNNNSDNNLNSPKKANNNINNTNNNNTKGVGDSPSEDRAKHGGDSGGGGGGSGGGGGGGGGQLSTAERQEIQMKKAKLVAMLDEAEQRYRHYNHQMQLVIESFEQAAGMGSAKTYTALALKTISKQFRCLKDAIHGQIKAANKMLGDDHEGGGSGSSAGGKIEGSRLKYIDHQIRQQRALQQLGMIQNPNAWRPQRGLPERSVSVLRAWLFEHFLHPYPKDSDKIMLAKQTGLTRSQVSNWFINARVRLWKPMIEEMYTEELKEQEQNNGLSEEKLANSSKENSHNEDNAGSFNPINNQESINIAENNLVKSCKDQNNNANAVAANTSSFIGNNSLTQNQHGFTLSSSFEMEGGISQRSPKRQRNEEMFPSYNNGSTNPGEILIKFGNEKHERENTDGNGNGNGYPIISGGMNFLGGGELAGAYPIAEMGRFETEDFSAPPRFLHGNGISLSLGLPPSENHHQQLDNLSATNHTFMSPNPSIQFRRTNEFGSMNSPSSHSSAAAFECIDIQNRKGFATQLLPDFVT